MKPLGISLDMRVIRPTRAEDRIWEAVEEAQCENMTPARFINHVREAWKYHRDEQAKSDDAELSRKADVSSNL